MDNHKCTRAICKRNPTASHHPDSCEVGSEQWTAAIAIIQQTQALFHLATGSFYRHFQLCIIFLMLHHSLCGLNFYNLVLHRTNNYFGVTHNQSAYGTLYYMTLPHFTPNQLGLHLQQRYIEASLTELLHAVHMQQRQQADFVSHKYFVQVV